ncbi:hypothetical protein N7468_010377 [Penicillium chermesinum]|uniref:RGS domain-containing protein n=1 Tax=Penicillium chermesinum TaxID=63820 RepID=A0A9W9TCG8_9EURO|nr:uncharacterized protein N7468_010377 [Penicillium chermesinum]KAJ5217369.1 hypothetical protein N7468_010377 [Penicillium chermesinum]
MGSELGVTATSKPGPVINTATIFWMAFGVVWTLVLCLGVGYLIKNRNTPTVRIRGLWLCLFAIVFLHLYAWSVQFGPMLGPMMPGEAEYWLMGLWLPLGLSFFHASNARFLYVARLQKKFVYPSNRLNTSSRGQSNSLIARFRRLDYSSKILITVGLGTLIQMMLTVLMYLISRKYHSSWGIPGTEVTGGPVSLGCSSGAGLLPPYVLWKSWDIKDTQGWRLQTIGCAIAGLPAIPMYLAALYAPAMAKIQSVWIPPQWICLSIFFIEIFTIGVPCWEVANRQVLIQETLNSIAHWEVKKNVGGENKSIESGSTMIGSLLSGFKSMTGSVKTDHSSDSILTMGALEHVLERNPAPLQEACSPQLCAKVPSRGSDRDAVRHSFNRALAIYAEYVSPAHAEFPVNLSSSDVRKLDQVFEKPARIVYGEAEEAAQPTNPVSPFRTEFDLPATSPMSSATHVPNPPKSPTMPLSPTSTLFQTPSANSGEKGFKNQVAEVKDLVKFWGEISPEFDHTIFDDAERSIKYLVLTNTWPKFIKSQRASTGSSVTLENGSDVLSMAREKYEK